MLNETQQHFFKKLIDDTFGYYRVYDYLKLRIRQATKLTITFTTSESFWSSILQNEFKCSRNNQPKLQNNQIVKLKDFFLTEWTPKLPGRVWTRDGEMNLIEGIQDVVGETNIHDKIYNVLGPSGKGKMMTGGFGSVRIKPRTNSDYCMLLNAVSVNDWHCDYGIPLIVSKPVYDEYLRYSHNEGAPEIEELTGILCLNSGINQLGIIFPAIGAKLDDELQDLLSDFPNLPKCFIYVSSPIDIKLRYNMSHPDAIAWTMFKTNIDREPLRLTYARFNPINEDSSKEAIKFINNYVLGFDGIEILTDFDGQKRRLISKSSLSNTRNFKFQHSRVLRTIGSWIRRESHIHKLGRNNGC
ncbi:hypothetical protein [Sunxiuqinia rutila]|uniref:hypothetical protein n=1 Tax=Sunxiuqinia rutila TaxID=1397841 RepID=UPI003D366C6E